MILAGRLAETLAFRLFKRFPPRPEDVVFREATGRPAAEYDDEVARPFFRYFGAGIEMYSGKDVLDLGSGYGGRTVAFTEYGARSATGIEIQCSMASYGRRFAAERRSGARFAVGLGERLPFRDGCFDLVVMNDVMEHVVSPEFVLAEARRVLRAAGRAAVVFPPYYDVTAGSHLHGYATRLPAMNLFFTTETLKRAAVRLLTELGVDYRAKLREVPTDELWNQNGLTARRFRALVRGTGFAVERLHYLGHLDRRLATRRGIGYAVRFPFYRAAELLAAAPLTREVLCSRVCAILRTA